MSHSNVSVANCFLFVSVGGENNVLLSLVGQLQFALFLNLLFTFAFSCYAEFCALFAILLDQVPGVFVCCYLIKISLHSYMSEWSSPERRDSSRRAKLYRSNAHREDASSKEPINPQLTACFAVQPPCRAHLGARLATQRKSALQALRLKRAPLAPVTSRRS